MIFLKVPDEFEIVSTIPCPQLPYNIPGTTYLCAALKSDDITSLTGSCVNVTLKYIVKDCDSTTGQVLDDEG